MTISGIKKRGHIGKGSWENIWFSIQMLQKRCLVHLLPIYSFIITFAGSPEMLHLGVKLYVFMCPASLLISKSSI